jgi:hypothetical protein
MESDMRKTYIVFFIVLAVTIYACSDDAVLEPNEPESCTNTTCRPDMISFPVTHLDVNRDGDPDIIIRSTGMAVCPTDASDCSGYSFRILEPVDSIYFACDETTFRANALSLNDTIDSRLNYSQGGEGAHEKIRIAEIYQEGEWDPFWSGAFVNSEMKFLGFKIIESGEEYYGWVGLRVSEYDGSLYLSTFCYSSGAARIAGVCP